jgi:hypothetical protein
VPLPSPPTGSLPASMLSDGRRGFIPPATGPGEAWVGSAIQGRGPPLLDRPRVTANGGEIRSHGSGFPRPGGIMLPKKPRAGLLEFPRTAVAGVAGGGENLRRGLAGIQV